MNAVVPAAIDTNMLIDIQNNITPNEAEVFGKVIKKIIPLGRLGAPSEVAYRCKVPVYFDTGQVMTVTYDLYIRNFSSSTYFIPLHFAVRRCNLNCINRKAYGFYLTV